MENSAVNLTKRPLRLEPIERYVELQGRFSLTKEQLQRMQEFVNKRWKMLLEGKLL
jgi:pyruvate/2-oxoacid:ferredoxin oxidoreductase beta subunit